MKSEEIQQIKDEIYKTLFIETGDLSNDEYNEFIISFSLEINIHMFRCIKSDEQTLSLINKMLELCQRTIEACDLDN